MPSAGSIPSARNITSAGERTVGRERRLQQKNVHVPWPKGEAVSAPMRQLWVMVSLVYVRRIYVTRICASGPLYHLGSELGTSDRTSDGGVTTLVENLDVVPPAAATAHVSVSTYPPPRGLPEHCVPLQPPPARPAGPPNSSVVSPKLGGLWPRRCTAEPAEDLSAGGATS